MGFEIDQYFRGIKISHLTPQYRLHYHLFSPDEGQTVEPTIKFSHLTLGHTAYYQKFSPA
jgi:hypothetical protein